ncbi:MAG: hypothetical protein ACRD2W_17940 [Acidimicrobiales bacterium]
MTSRPPRLAVVAWSAVFSVGVVLFVASYLPVMNPEQCPASVTQAQMDESRCIVGSNIGAGLARMVGVVVTLAGGVAGLVALSRGLRD